MTSNYEGYQDPTAEQAIRNMNMMPAELYRCYLALRGVARLFDLEITEIYDKRTGKQYEIACRRKRRRRGGTR